MGQAEIKTRDVPPITQTTDPRDVDEVRGREIDLRGTRPHGAELFVVKRIGTDSGGGAVWFCRCDCGRIAIRTTGALQKSGHHACLVCRREERAGWWTVQRASNVERFAAMYYFSGTVWSQKAEHDLSERIRSDLRAQEIDVPGDEHVPLEWGNVGQLSVVPPFSGNDSGQRAAYLTPLTGRVRRCDTCELKFSEGFGCLACLGLACRDCVRLELHSCPESNRRSWDSAFKANRLGGFAAGERMKPDTIFVQRWMSDADRRKRVRQLAEKRAEKAAARANLRADAERQKPEPVRPRARVGWDWLANKTDVVTRPPPPAPMPPPVQTRPMLREIAHRHINEIYDALARARTNGHAIPEALQWQQTDTIAVGTVSCQRCYVGLVVRVEVRPYDNLYPGSPFEAVAFSGVQSFFNIAGDALTMPCRRSH